MNDENVERLGPRRVGCDAALEPERAISALNHIDAGCSREEWVRVGMAAKAADLTFDDFHTWSASGHNYVSERDCRSVWNSFDSGGGVTVATLFGAAFEAGWTFDQKAGGSLGAPINIHHQAPSKIASNLENRKATQVWELCEPAPPDHPYIVRKGGATSALRVYPSTAPELIIRDKDGAHSVAGWLVVPCMADGRLQTLQLISCEGRKLNLPGASFNDGFFVVGQINAADVIYVVEGIGQAWATQAANGAAAAVTFGAGRMPRVAAALRALHPAARLVLLPDRGKESQAREIAAELNCSLCELPENNPINYDVNDYLQEEGAVALAKLLQAPKSAPMRFRLLSSRDLSLLPPLRWMVRGILPNEGLAALFGPSGGGKSFLVLDLAAAVAGGQHEWFGRKVSQRPVTYCALEGESGMGKRVAAWGKHHGRPAPEALRFMAQPFDLLASGDVIDLAKAVLAAGGASGLIIIDTLNRAAPGADENSSVDMGKLIAAAKQLQDLTGGLVLLVHHTGKDVSRGLRGHSSLYAALDGAIEVSRSDGRREWGVAKSKDDETGQVHPFRLEVVTIGIDDAGDEITSCVVVGEDVGCAVKRVKLPKGDNQKIALDTLGQLLRESKEFDKDGAPPGHPCVRWEDALAVVAERLPCEAKRRNERAEDALNGFVKKKILAEKEGWLWRV